MQNSNTTERRSRQLQPEAALPKNDQHAEGRYYLARDYLLGALMLPSDELQYRLEQIHAAGLLDAHLSVTARQLAEALMIIEFDLRGMIRNNADASELLLMSADWFQDKEPKSFSEEVDLYRQAAFVAFRADASMMEDVEARLRALAGLHQDAGKLAERIAIDLGEEINPPEVPSLASNRYVKLVAEINGMEAEFEAHRARQASEAGEAVSAEKEAAV